MDDTAILALSVALGVFRLWRLRNLLLFDYIIPVYRITSVFLFLAGIAIVAISDLSSWHLVWWIVVADVFAYILHSNTRVRWLPLRLVNLLLPSHRLGFDDDEDNER